MNRVVAFKVVVMTDVRRCLAGFVYDCFPLRCQFDANNMDCVAMTYLDLV